MEVNITIVVPVYNVEKYLKKTVNSIRNQKIEDMEIILVDDGSTDDSGKICDEFAMIDSRIRVIHQNNFGVSSARNKGILNASGKYIMFVDADDILKENSLGLLLKIAEENDADIAIGAMQVRSVKGKNISLDEDFSLSEYDRIEALKIFFRNSGEFETYTACSKLYSKNVYSKILFEEGRSSNEDRYYFYKAILHSNKIVNKNMYIYEYNRRNGSLSTNDIDIRILDNVFFAEKMYFDVKKNIVDLENDAKYNLLITYMWVYRNFLRDYNAKKMYINEIKELKNNILIMYKEIKLSRVKKCEVWVIKYFNFLYSFLLKIADGVRRYEK